jgi:hypothetical protein
MARGNQGVWAEGKNLYEEAVDTAQSEPEHPEFTSFLIIESGGQESSYSVDELGSLEIQELIKVLTGNQGGRSSLLLRLADALTLKG